jgi:hypothetical protein
MAWLDLLAVNQLVHRVVFSAILFGDQLIHGQQNVKAIYCLTQMHGIPVAQYCLVVNVFIAA